MPEHDLIPRSLDICHLSATIWLFTIRFLTASIKTAISATDSNTFDICSVCICTWWLGSSPWARLLLDRSQLVGRILGRARLRARQGWGLGLTGAMHLGSASKVPWQRLELPLIPTEHSYFVDLGQLLSFCSLLHHLQSRFKYVQNNWMLIKAPICMFKNS